MQNRFLTTARVAGILYLIVAVCAGFAEIVRTSLVESDDAAATVENIMDSEFLFRLGFSSDIVAFTAEVGLAFVFYALFRPVNQILALTSAAFRLGQAVSLAANLLNQFMAILLIEGEEYLGVFDSAQIDALVLLFMKAQSIGYLIGLVFFGISTAVLGYLVLKSGAFPAILGILLLVVVPAGYILDSFTTFLISDKDDIISEVLIIPATLSELAFIAWLLIKGTTIEDRSGEQAAA